MAWQWHTKKIQVCLVRGLRLELFAGPPAQIDLAGSSTKLGRAEGGLVLQRNGPNDDETRGGHAIRVTFQSKSTTLDTDSGPG